MKKLKPLLIGLLLAGLTATARADLMWDWSFTTAGVPGAYPVSGSGTLTTDPGSGGAYQVTGIAGTFGGKPITSLNSTYGPPDNIIYNAGSNGFDNSQLDSRGLSFDDNTGNQVNIFDNSPDEVFDYYGNYGVGGTFTATEVMAAPEPPSLIGAGTVLAILLGPGIRKYRLSRKSA